MNPIKVNTSWKQRNCPICGLSSVSSAEVSAKTPAESLSFEDVKPYFIGLRDEQIFFSYFRCSNCECLYCPYYFSESELDILYSEMPDNLLGAEKSTAEKTQIGYVNWFLKFVQKSKDYLELGPDIGLVTRGVLSNLEPENAYLVEPNTLMHPVLQDLQTPKTNVTVVRDVFEIRGKNFDLSIAIHVVDHLLDPNAQVRKIAESTIIGGFAGIVVHDEGSILRKCLGRKWPPFCLQHPQLFNRKTLTTLMKENGFEKVRISKSINYFQISHLGSLAISIIGLPKFLTRFLPNIEVPLILGNQISIFQKKS